MVLRKPDNLDLVPAPLSQAVNNPPYPTTPTSSEPPSLPPVSEHHANVYSPDLHTSPAFQFKPLDDARRTKYDDDSDYDNNSDWDKTDDEDDGKDRTSTNLPGSLRIGGGLPIKQAAEKGLPSALRPGPPDGVIRKSHETQSQEQGMAPSSYGAASTSSRESVPLKSQNPYLRMQNTGQSTFGGETSAQAWGDVPLASAKYDDPVELPTEKTPIDQFAKMSLPLDYPQSPASTQPPLIPVETETTTSPCPRHDSNASSPWDPGMDISSLDAFSRTYGLPSDTIQEESPQRTWQAQQAWEQSERERKQNELAVAHEAALHAEAERMAEQDWHRGEQEARTALQEPSGFQTERPPELPPRRSQEQEHAPPKPPRPPVETGGLGISSNPTGVETPDTKARRQRKEHYQIKHIRWFDANKRGIRKSPILTQNANGPCPLLALVNALVLSTPANEETALIETLRTREQVSLGLLLDAVFDELMSGRRGGAAQGLPDVGELYQFLVTLHTGMNVNPSFVKAARSAEGVSNIHPSLRHQPGGFEDTREMRLYSTFNIPLIHGWLPPSESRAYVAFDRVAKTYEDAQHIQFQEEELDSKLRAEGLNQDEQRLFEDVHAIKDFLTKWPTQLSDYGLQAIISSLKPGQIGILFRNDHFSTLYKEPRSEQLLTLVTDAGYSSHEEIVWESLVDISGQRSELFSGDFRPVGNNQSTNANPRTVTQRVQSMLDIDGNQGWSTVQSRNRRSHQTSASTSALQTRQESGVVSRPASTIPPPTTASKIEQEDHDLALALQLQEEEEDRHRRSLEERRRRENELSEQAISQHSRNGDGTRRPRNGENPPLIPPRRNNVSRPTVITGDNSIPPPTYEEAASGRAYHPPPDHPASPHAPVRPPGQQGSAYLASSAQLPPSLSGRRRSSRPGALIDQIPPGSGLTRPTRRQSAGIGGTSGVGAEDRDKCVVM
ncbi:hypothetical protein K432DRAFT_377586 [Lepidopterella palustris CBS 459.81]|uniref:MINDY deubiquitinase domain-containing protein n=1 Tax=Lepidopterella palustris CBS 459.81 TaxID=1314670 RepID=A0A8E2JJZ1_9PEZI|nr:hypothetical protein K432DRAFT_377586 [Lepidopterella palustris CBS 459.81]